MQSLSAASLYMFLLIEIIRFQNLNNNCCILAHCLQRISPNFHVVSKACFTLTILSAFFSSR